MFEPLDDPRPPTFDAAFRRRVVRRAHQRRRRRLAGGAGAAAVAVVAGAAGVYGPSVWRARDLERVEVAGTAPVANGEPVTVLVLGADGPRTDGVTGTRVDTIVLARLDPEAGRLSLLSLPRDLMVTDPTRAPVEQQIGVPLDHVVQVDFSGFAGLVDRIGGVDVRVDDPVRDVASGLLLEDTGCVTLDGEEALALVRSRSVEHLQPDGTWLRDPHSDLRRVETQRAVVAAALAGLDRLGWTPAEMRSQVEWAVDHVTIDAGLSLEDLVQLGSSAAALGPDDVAGATLPVVPHPSDANRLAADPAAAPAAVAAFVAGDPLPPIAPLGAGEPPSVAPVGPVVAPC
jgi:LCP family protein required for cell wall assembly